ncbi:MAG: 2TM domain-containing protein [Sphaerospermopsis sp.]|nr:2TM domain-containing protein [Sphaerospermopsis sp.]
MTSESNKLRFYTQEEVQEILNLAIARQSKDLSQEFSYQQILEIAKEMQIEPETVLQAKNEWVALQSEARQRKAFNTYRQNKLKKSIVNYIVINAFFVLTNLISSASLTWSLYILMFSGLVILLEVWNTFRNRGEEYEAAFQKWNRQHQIKQTVNKVISKVINKWFKPRGHI